MLYSGVGILTVFNNGAREQQGRGDTATKYGRTVTCAKYFGLASAKVKKKISVQFVLRD
jgi:hypothetical protein